jgi:hypothetical protein
MSSSWWCCIAQWRCGSDLQEVSDWSVVVCSRGHPRPSYIGRRSWATSLFPSILVGYVKESLSGLSWLTWTLSCLLIFGSTRQVGQGPLIGRQVVWLAGPTCRGRLRPWSVGTHGVAPSLVYVYTFALGIWTDHISCPNNAPQSAI